MSKKISEIVKLFKSGMAYTLFVDAGKWEAEKGYISYEKRETNSVMACCHALTHAFTDDIDNPAISLDLIIKLHKIAVSKVHPNPNLKDKLAAWKKEYSREDFRTKGFHLCEKIPAGFRSIPTAIPVPSDSELDLTFSSTSGTYWFSSTCELQQCAEAQEKKEINPTLSGKRYYEKFITSKHQESKQNYIDKSDGGNPLPTKCGSGYHYLIPPTSKEDIIKKLEYVINQYNKNIKLFKNDNKKIELILKTIKLIELIHPFHDANLRTSIILMQRLLMQNNLSLCAFTEPNDIDNHSIKSLLEAYKTGASTIDNLLKLDKDFYCSKPNEIIENAEDHIRKNYTNATDECLRKLRSAHKLTSEHGAENTDDCGEITNLPPIDPEDISCEPPSSATTATKVSSREPPKRPRLNKAHSAPQPPKRPRLNKAHSAPQPPKRPRLNKAHSEAQPPKRPRLNKAHSEAPHKRGRLREALSNPPPLTVRINDVLPSAPKNDGSPNYKALFNSSEPNDMPGIAWGMIQVLRALESETKYKVTDATTTDMVRVLLPVINDVIHASSGKPVPNAHYLSLLRKRDRLLSWVSKSPQEEPTAPASAGPTLD